MSARVVINRGIEKLRLLRDDGELAPQTPHVERRQRRAVDLDRAAGRFVEPQQHVERRRLARAAPSHQRERRARGHDQRQAAEHGLLGPRRVAEGDVVVVEARAARPRVRRRRRAATTISRHAPQQPEHALRGAGRAREGGKKTNERVVRVLDFREVQLIRHKLARGKPRTVAHRRGAAVEKDEPARAVIQDVVHELRPSAQRRVDDAAVARGDDVRPVPRGLGLFGRHGLHGPHVGERLRGRAVGFSQMREDFAVLLARPLRVRLRQVQDGAHGREREHGQPPARGERHGDAADQRDDGRRQRAEERR
mmetsp:Transcript_8944/g.27084  ORF Transcript_8944/g.27084 Transcript_8944/m.27084 type:complete len:309 (+) Transcript_8944:638-1564(+)